MNKGLLVVITILVAAPMASKCQDKDQAIELEAVYSGLPLYNSKGGIKTGFKYMDNLDLTAKVNFDRLFNFDDPLSLFVYGLRNNGQRATDLMGDFQVASNIEAVESWRIFELFVQHNFFNNRISVLTGLYDLNSEFDILRPGTLFINSSFGIGAEYAQAGKNGPSIFPVSSFGVRLATRMGNRIRLRVAALDGVPGDPNDLASNKIRLSIEDGALLAGEVSIFTGKSHSRENAAIERSYETRRRKVGREFEDEHFDKINIGAWYFTGKFQAIGDSLTMDNGNFGIYVGAQKYIYFTKEKDHYLSLFARVGFSNSRFNRIKTAWSGGAVITVPFTPWDDQLGIAVTSAFTGENYLDAREGLENHETAFEFTYSLPVAHWLLLQPDIQYVTHPSFSGRLNSPLSFALLLQLSINN